MKIAAAYRRTALTFFVAALICVSNAFAAVQLHRVGTSSSGIYNQSAAEIAAYDSQTKRIFAVNGATSKIDVLSLVNPAAPTLLFSIDVSPYGRPAGKQR